MKPWSICLTPYQDAPGWIVFAAVESVDGGCRICYRTRSRAEATQVARAIQEHFHRQAYPTKAEALTAAIRLLHPALAFPFRVAAE